MTLRLGIVTSHEGSNLRAIVEAWRTGSLDAEPRVVISNNRDSGALSFAREAGIPGSYLSPTTHPDAESLDEAILHALRDHDVELVLLLGYMKKLGPKTLAAFPGKVLNIHPALLPKYGGKGMYGIYVHEAVIAAGDKVTGVTIHLADDEYDHGRIVAQTKMAVLPDDTPKSLQERVREREHEFLIETLQKLSLA